MRPVCCPERTEVQQHHHRTLPPSLSSLPVIANVLLVIQVFSSAGRKRTFLLPTSTSSLVLLRAVVFPFCPSKHKESNFSSLFSPEFVFLLSAPTVSAHLQDLYFSFSSSAAHRPFLRFSHIDCWWDFILLATGRLRGSRVLAFVSSISLFVSASASFSFLSLGLTSFCP